MISIEESSFWEVTPDDIVNMSIVFHCNGGTRAFCAPFVATGTEASETIPSQDGTTVMADFSSADGYSSDSAVYVYATGAVNISLDGSEITDDTDCDEWYYGIFETGTVEMNGGALWARTVKAMWATFGTPRISAWTFRGRTIATTPGCAATLTTNIAVIMTMTATRARPEIYRGNSER